MDLNNLMGTMLSGTALTGLSQKTGTSQKDVMNVLSTALPSMLSGAQAQANGAQTAEGFVGALADHAKDNTADLSSFLSNVDLKDGQKIVNHLLGSNAKATAQTAAKNAGVSVTKANNILSGAAPLLMSLLGQQTAASTGSGSAQSTSAVASLMGSLLQNVDVTSLLVGLLANNASGSAQQQSAASNNESKPGNLLGNLLGLFKG